MTDLALPFAAGAIAFYCYDALQLLPGNALLLMRRGRHWSATVGTDTLLAGRYLAFPAPWSARAEIYALHWSEFDSRAGATDVARLEALHRALWPVAWICTALLALLWLALPLGAWWFGSGLALLLIVAVYYLLTGIALVVVFRRRKALALGQRGYWQLAFDSLACAPFAANLVRRITLRQALGGEPLATLQALLATSAMSGARAAVARRIESYCHAAQSDRADTLNALLARWRQGAS